MAYGWSGISNVIYKFCIVDTDGESIMSSVMEIQDDSFELEVIQAGSPVLVDFWAPWCGPCKAIGPIIDELAEELGNEVKFTKCNVDDNPTTPSRYNIKAIPTLVFFKDGEVVEKITGVVSKSKLEESIGKISD